MPNSQMRKLLPMAAVLGVVLLLLLIRSISSRGGEDGMEDPIFKTLVAEPFRVSDVHRVVLEGREKADAADADGKPATVELVRDAKGWSVPSHYNAPGDKEKIEAFIRNLKAIGGEIRVEKAKDLKEYGLDEAQALRVRLVAEGGKDHMDLLVGGSTNSSQGVFARTSGSKDIYVVDLNVRNEIGLWSKDQNAPKADEWVDKMVLKLDADRAKKIVMDWPERRLVLEKVPAEDGQKKDPPPPLGGSGSAGSGKSGAKWKMKKSSVDLVYKMKESKNIVSALESFDASKILDPAKIKDYKLDQDKTPYKLVVTYEDGSEVVVKGAPAEDNTRVATCSLRPGVLYEISEWKFSGVFKQADTLFILPGLTLTKDSLTRIATSGEGYDREFTKGPDGTWKMTRPKIEHGRTDQGADDIIGALTGLKPKDAVAKGDDAARGLDPAARTLVYELGGGKKTVLRFGKTATGHDGPYVRLDPDKPLTTVIDKYDYNRLFPKWTDLIESRVYSGLNKEDIIEAAVTGMKSDFTLRKKGGAWQLVRSGKTVPGKQEAIEKWLDDLAQVTADDIRIGGKAGKGAATIKVKTETGGKHVFLLAKTADGKSALWRPDRKLTFILSASTDGKLQVDNPARFKAPQEAKKKQDEKKKDETTDEGKKK